MRGRALVTSLRPALARWWKTARPVLHRAVLASAAPAGHVWAAVAKNGQGVAGLVVVSIGAGQVYGPAGWLTAGVLLLLDRAVDDHRVARGGGKL